MLREDRQGATMGRTKALVIGNGSIGQRHSRILVEKNFKVCHVSGHSVDAYRTVDQAFLGEGNFDYVVISSETTRHRQAVIDLHNIGYRGPLLVEKPIVAQFGELDQLSGISHDFAKLGVAYNLRFHPVVRALRDALLGERIFECRIRVGQYLPSWRPASDYRSGSSALLSAGGGVLRDLSHEIDMQLHLFGPWSELVSAGGRLGVLDIETDEVWSVLARTGSGLVTMTLNYFDRLPERQIVVTTSNDTFVADLIAGTLSSNDGTRRFEVARDDSYRLQHDAMLGNGEHLCTFEEAAAVMQMIRAVEQSNSEKRWITT